MKYYSELIVIYSDGRLDTKSIYEAESPDAAIKRCHSGMGVYMGADGVASVAVRAFNSIEGEYAKYYWVAPQPEPEPEVEPAEE